MLRNTFLRIVSCLVLVSASAVHGADNRAATAPKGSGLIRPSVAPAESEMAAAMEEGEINGAKFVIARPAKWNRNVLLLAHGFRAEGSPLVADLFVGHGAYASLLAEGWIVAKTSYRRNGMIVADAIADLDALRTHIEQKYGTLNRVLLEGDSMGGLIVTLMAERAFDGSGSGRPLYAGAVAVGAALNVKETNQPIEPAIQPKVPLIFLTNQSELEGPKAYATTRRPTDSHFVPAVLFKVSRNGHVNVNQAERLLALRALNAWLDRGPAALPTPQPGQPFFDATCPPAPQSSQVKMQSSARGFEARVTEISAIYGNVQINAQPADFEAAGIKPLTWFQLKVGEKTYRIRYGRDFEDVKRGEWIAFPNADGFTWLARNYANAATSAELKLDDAVMLQSFDSH